MGKSGDSEPQRAGRTQWNQLAARGSQVREAFMTNILIARRRDLHLVELAVKKGADVFLRDRKGRKVLEHEKNADERIKVFLKQCEVQM